MNQVVERLKRELILMNKSPPENCSAGPVDDGRRQAPTGRRLTRSLEIGIGRPPQAAGEEGEQ